MTSHYLRYANLAANLQPAMPEEDLVGALTFHYPIVVQSSLISGNFKTTQDAINLLGKLDTLEARDDYRTPGRTLKIMMQAGDLGIIRRVIGETGTNVIVYGYSRYNTRMDPSMTGSERTVRRINTTEEGTTTGWGEQEERRRSRRRHYSSLSLNPAEKNFRTLN
jgi:hypothetical protein